MLDWREKITISGFESPSTECNLQQTTWYYECYCSILLTAGNHIDHDRPTLKGIIAGSSEKDIRHEVAF